jgi:hypothetical protein
MSTNLLRELGKNINVVEVRVMEESSKSFSQCF